MDFSTFRNLRIQDHETWISCYFHRPQQMNALSRELIKELKSLMDYLSTQKQCRALVLGGEGKAWSAGADLNSFKENPQNQSNRDNSMMEEGLAIIEKLESLPLISIASVNGYCFTGALELLLAFDLVIAADNAQFADTHCKWGLYPRWGMSQRLPHKIGFLKARELSYTARRVGALEAEKIGLINRVVPTEDLEQETQNWVEELLSNSAQTQSALKELYRYGSQHGLSAGLQYEWDQEYAINDREEFLRDFKKNKNPTSR